MALEISGSINLLNGLSVDSCYGRTTYNVNETSSLVSIRVEYWKDKLSYESGLISLTADLISNKLTTYNRDVDGSDILNFTQQVIKTELEAQGYSVVITEL